MTVFSRLIGGAVGALVTFALLWLNHADTGAWATAAIVGAVAAFLWPIVIGWYLAHRGRVHRDDAIEAEVERRVARHEEDPPR
jgi:type VI protein secretion system component VasK